MINKLRELFTKYKIDFSEEMLVKLNQFYSDVLAKNEVMNLTNLTSIDDFSIKNVLDSVLPYKAIPLNSTVVDVGAGAGFPSVPLCIIRPDLKITMVDSLNKRISFLKEEIASLELNATALHYRAEDFAHLNREKYDVAVSRAVAGLNILCEYCLPLVKVGGLFIAYKSMKADEELMDAKKALSILGGQISHSQNVFIKEIDSIRINVMIKKVSNTPKEYPRSKNLPKLKPII